MTTLKKVLKLRTVTSASAGMALATSCYIAGFQIATMLVGELAWISVLIAGALCFLSAMCFSELTSQYPTAAGIKLFIQKAFNEKIAIIIGTFYVLLGISMVGAESYLLSSVMYNALPIIGPLVDKLFWMIFFIVFVAAINYRGVQLTGFVQDVMTYVMIAFLIIASLYSIFKYGVDIKPALASPKFTLANIINAAGVGVFLFVGFEWVTPLAEETTDYRLIGKGMFIAIGLLTLTYALFTVGMWISLTPAQRLSGSPIPHILFGGNLFGKVGIALFMLMSILASTTSFNSGLLNTSRFAYAMSRDNVLPAAFSKLHPDYATPWVSILGLMVFALLVSLLILFTGKYLFIIVMAAALECFIYVVMAICVIKLRRSMPDNPRDFKVPGGYVIPIITIIVFAGLFIGIFVDTSKDYAGNILFANYWVAIVMAAFFGICAVYTLTVVPMLKKKAAEKAATRVKRRPGKISE